MKEAPPGRFYGRRKGKKLRPGQATLLRTLLPQLTVSLPRAGAPLDLPALFAMKPEAVWLEIGFGGGEHLAALAKAHPEIGFIGCEPFVNGVVKLLSAVAQDDLANIRIHGDVALPLLEALAQGSLARVFILFPDPWPKLRHHKRRIVSPETLDLLAAAMAPGAELRLATDDHDYARWMLELIGVHPAFAGPPPDASLESLLDRPDDWPPTRYQAKAIGGGRRPVYLAYRRRTPAFEA